MSEWSVRRAERLRALRQGLGLRSRHRGDLPLREALFLSHCQRRPPWPTRRATHPRSPFARADAPARAASQLRDAPVGRWRRFAGRPRAARPRQPADHADLYARLRAGSASWASIDQRINESLTHKSTAVRPRTPRKTRLGNRGPAILLAANPTGPHDSLVRTYLHGRLHRAATSGSFSINRWEGETRGCCHDETTARGRCALRASNSPLEPQNEAVLVRRAQRDLHHRFAPDLGAHRDTWPTRYVRDLVADGGNVLFVGHEKADSKTPSPSSPTPVACHMSTNDGSVAC